MENARRLPSYIVPLQDINVGKLKIVSAHPVTVNDDWGREHYSGSITVIEDGFNGVIDKWIYFHSLLTDSRLPLYTFFAKGEEASDFQLRDFDNKGNLALHPRVLPFDPEDINPVVYLAEPSREKINYEAAYQNFLSKDDSYYAALKNYFISQDIGHNPRLRGVDVSYWEIVMLISSLEALLPKPTYCMGKCEICGKGLKHLINDVSKEWDDIVFKHITNKKIRNQYRQVLDEARWRIRNDTVHNGGEPGKTMWKSDPLPNGVTEFTTEKSLAGYKSDRNSLDSFVEQLRQACRYILLNQIIGQDIFPLLKGIEVHSFTITSTNSPTIINLDF